MLVIEKGGVRPVKKVYVGLPQSGKTEKLIGEYQKIVEYCARTENILALVMSLPESRKWRGSLSMRVAGAIQIYTFWGFVQREILRFWHLVQPHLGDGENVIQPTFLNAESAHHLMTLLVNEARIAGRFGAMIATSSRIALQLLNNLNQAALNGISIEDATRRLIVTCNGDERKMSAMKDALIVAGSFRRQCLSSRCPDYSLSVDIYNRYLLPEPRYQEILRSTYRHLFVDNLEEAVPAEVDLIGILFDSVENAFFSYDPSGGHTRSFGADPELASNKIFPQCEIDEFKTLYGCSEQSARLATVLGDNIQSGSGMTAAAGVIEESGIETEFRAEMISELGKTIIDLLGRGAPPNEIAVVAPAIDTVLEQSLTRQLGDAGYSLQNLTRRSLLSDEPYAQLMVNIAALAQPGIGWPSSTSSLSYCFRLVLGLDPVRSSLLAHHCLMGGAPKLPDLDAERLRARVGFGAGERYDRFRNLVEQLQNAGKTENLFQRIFSDILAPFVHDNEDIATSRQVIDSAIKFANAYGHMPKLRERSLVEGFLDMLTQGTVAAEVFKSKELARDAVILTTPLGLFRSGLSVERQFWVDCSDASWYFKGYSELSNAEIMRQNWDGAWNDEVEQGTMKRNAALRIRGLLHRCRGRVTIVQSCYSGLGYEQQGLLPEIVFDSVVTGT
jgi:hypothetical protein